jgi:hypothetical protein
MPRIFICYRRDDTAGHAGRLRDALSAEFGAQEVFRDVDTLGPGDDFVQAVDRGIASCRVFLAIVGRQWLTSPDRAGRRRIDDPADHVRTEIVEALAGGVRVIPVLVQGASMPVPADLPDNIRRFADRNAIELDDDEWASDVGRLFDAIRQELHVSARPRDGSSRPVFRAAMVGLLAVAALLVVFVMARRQSEPAAPTGGSSSGITTQASFPAGAEARIGPVAYEAQDAAVTTANGIRTLTVRMQATNRSQYDATFFDSGFRLDVDGQTVAATSGNVEVVAGNSSKEHAITFPLPPHTANATLRVTSGGETADMPVDLNGWTGPSAAQDRELRRSGKRTFAVPLAPDAARLRFGDLTCELRSASLHRYANKLALTLDIRVRNASRYDAEFGDSHFRLVLDETARPPVSGVSTVVAGESSSDAAIAFDLPLNARQAVLRTRFGEQTIDVPLQLPATR